MTPIVFDVARKRLADLWLEQNTELVSVKRRTWRTLWLVERTHRERRLKPSRLVVLSDERYDPDA